MIAMTTKSSISVKPRRDRVDEFMSLYLWLKMDFEK